MNGLIKIEVGKVTKEVKGLEIIKQTCLKTKTNLEIKFTEKDQGLQELITDEISLLKLDGEKVTSFMITVEGAKALGRIINRSQTAFNKIGLQINDLDWEAIAGVVEIEGEITTLDLPYLVEICLRLTQRATRAISYTHHPLTLFDLKQTIGHTYDMKQKLDGAQDMTDWFDIRELIILEETKATKTEEKAKVKEEAKEKIREKKRVKDPKSGPNATTRQRKATAKKAGKTAQKKAKEKNLPKSAKKSATIDEIKSPGLKKAKLNLS